MATINQDTLHQEDEDQDQQQQTTPPPSPTTPPPAPAAPSSGVKPGTPTNSGRFVNLQKYLGANQNEGSRLANQVANPYEQQATQAKQATQQGAQQFQTAALSHRAPVYEENKSFISTALADPSKLQSGSEDYNKLANLVGANYSGPKDLTDTTDVADVLKKQQAVARAGELAGSEGGRAQLLKQQYGQPGQRYTGGFNKLDQLLLQRSNTGIQQLGALGGQATEVGNLLNTEQGKAQELANQYTGEAQNTAQQATGDVGNRVTGLQEEVQNKVNMERAAEDQRLAAKATLEDHLKNNTLTQDDIVALQDPSITKGINTFGVDPTKFLNYNNAQNLDLAGLANEQEAGGYNTLNQILGRNDRLTDFGKYQAGKQNFNASDFLKQIASKQQDLNTTGLGNARTAAENYRTQNLTPIQEQLAKLKTVMGANAQTEGSQAFIRNKWKDAVDRTDKRDSEAEINEDYQKALTSHPLNQELYDLGQKLSLEKNRLNILQDAAEHSQGNDLGSTNSKELADVERNIQNDENKQQELNDRFADFKSQLEQNINGRIAGARAAEKAEEDAAFQSNNSAIENANKGLTTHSQGLKDTYRQQLLNEANQRGYGQRLGQAAMTPEEIFAALAEQQYR